MFTLPFTQCDDVLLVLGDMVMLNSWDLCEFLGDRRRRRAGVDTGHRNAIVVKFMRDLPHPGRSNIHVDDLRIRTNIVRALPSSLDATMLVLALVVRNQQMLRW